jgi:tetratricopeptide (TPR) repeat protein
VRRAAVLLVALGLVALRAQPGADAAQREFARGVELQQRGDLEAARTAYEAALKISPRRVDTLSNLGLVYGRLGEYKLAVQTFQKALAADPRQPMVHFNLGLTYLQAGQYENARSEFAALKTAQPQNLAVRRMLGIALLKGGSTAGGVAELAAVQVAQPDDVELACTLASAYLKTRQAPQAQALVEGLLRRSDSAEAHLVSGSYYLFTKQYPDALAHLRRAFDLNADLPDLESTLADAYFYNGSPDLAAKMFAEELRRDPMDFKANLMLGRLYMVAQQTGPAAKYLERARQVKPDDPDLLFQLAWLARSDDRQQDAARLLEQVVSKQPGYKRAHVLLAQAYYRLKRNEDAAREQAIIRRLTQEEQAKVVAETSR